MLDVRDLRAGYGTKVVLHGITLELWPGEIVALLGPNGAGKTTALKTIMNLVRPQAGEIRLDGQPITGLPTETIVEHGIALVPEGRRIFPGLTVRDNLIAGSVCRRIGRHELERRIGMVLETFPGLAPRLGQYGWSLSGGEQQMLAIGRALCGAPRVLLIDEPSLGLAPTVIDEVFRTIARLAGGETAILLVEQNAWLAMEIAQRAYVLQAGHIIVQGTAAELREKDTLAAAYLAGPEDRRRAGA